MPGAGRSDRRKLAFASSHGALIVAAALCFTAVGGEQVQAANAETVAADIEPPPRFHLIRAGDTLSEIAEAYGLDWRDLARLNRLANPDRLEIGKMLVLSRSGPSAPREHVVRPGETLSGIAGKLGVDWRALARLNGLTDPDRLAVGAVLKIEAQGGDLLRPTRTAEARERFARKYGVDLPEGPAAAPALTATGAIPAPPVAREDDEPAAGSVPTSMAAFVTRSDGGRQLAAAPVAPAARPGPVAVRNLGGEATSVQQIGRARETLAAFARKYGVNLGEEALEAPALAPAPETSGSRPQITAAADDFSAVAAVIWGPPAARSTGPVVAALESHDGFGAPATEATGAPAAPPAAAAQASRPRIAADDDFSAVAAILRRPRQTPPASPMLASLGSRADLGAAALTRGALLIAPATSPAGPIFRSPAPSASPEAAAAVTAGPDAATEAGPAVLAAARAPAATSGAPASEAAVQTVSRVITPPGRKPAEAQLRSRLPLVVGGRPLATVAATVTLSEVISLSPADLAASLEALLNDETLERLKALGSDQAPIDQVRALGLNITLDTGTISLALDLPPTLRRRTVLGGTDSATPSDASTVKPARFAAGATGALLLSGDATGDGGTGGQFAVAGFVNVGGLRGLNLDYSGTYQFSGDAREFSRGPLVAFMDRPEKALRYSAGDLTPQSSSLAASAPILGISMERSYQRLQPSRVIRPMGSRSIFLERRATIEIISNGVLLKRFQAEAGPVDLRDLPLAATSNDVTVFVEDALGRRELDSFTLANDISLLAGGLDEFNISVGVLRDATGGQLQYTTDPVATGFYTRGLTNQLTVSGSFALSAAVKGASAAAAFPVLGGVTRIEAGYSNSADVGNGFAAGLAFRSDQVLGGAVSDNLIVRANFTSENYATLYDPLSTDQIKLDAGIDYQIALSRRTSVNVGAAFLSRYGASGDDRFLTAGVTRALGGLQISLRGRFGENNKGEREQSAFITVSRAFGVRNRASVSYDSSAERTRAEFVRSRRVDVPDVAFRLAAEDSPTGRTLSGSAGYYGARFEADAGLERDVGSSGGSGPQRYTARLQSGIAYADGVVAFGGDPARGFYLVRAHPSLGKARIEIEEGRSGGPTSAMGSGRWPAVGTVGTPYRQTDLSVAVLDAPVGYDVGDTRFSVMPGARSGFVLDVGSDNFRTRTATLMFDGLPVSLVFGHLVNIETGEEKTFFTNKAGRASFSNLAQGRYRITVNGIDGTYEFSLAKDSVVLEDLGTISLERK